MQLNLNENNQSPPPPPSQDAWIVFETPPPLRMLPVCEKPLVCRPKNFILINRMKAPGVPSRSAASTLLLKFAGALG